MAQMVQDCAKRKKKGHVLCRASREIWKTPVLGEVEGFRLNEKPTHVILCALFRTFITFRMLEKKKNECSVLART